MLRAWQCVQQSKDTSKTRQLRREDRKDELILAECFAPCQVPDTKMTSFNCPHHNPSGRKHYPHLIKAERNYGLGTSKV